jgi:membrane-associated phospholipid phosphatase
MRHLAPRAWTLAVLAVLCAPGAAFAQGAPGAVVPPPPPQQKEAAVPADGRTLVRLPANLVRATFGVFNVANLDPAVVGTVATGFLTMFDRQVAKALDDPNSELGPRLETGGSPLCSGAVVGALFVGGRFAGGPRFRAATYDWLEASLVTAGYTAVVKEIVGRTRPNGQDDKSFPSGHASNAFALATVAERHYGWKVGVAAYGLAGLVGLSRLEQNAHFLSDVIGGATLGYIVGRTVVRVNTSSTHPRRTQVNMSPVLARRSRALVVRVCWR